MSMVSGLRGEPDDMWAWCPACGEIVYIDELDGLALITLSKEFNSAYVKMEDLNRLKQFYLIKIRGLKKVRVMTKEELENELGCAIILVNKKVEEKTNEN